MNTQLSPFEKWMVKSNLKYIAKDGLKTVVARLKANGYPQIAAGVEEAIKAKRNQARRERESAYKELGMHKVKGAMGGTYWE